jgi:hypothetical protein
MSVLLFSLRNVPDDEADEVRKLLTANQIDVYETPAGGWGISAPAIWLEDENKLEQAKTLIERYQKERLSRQREAYETRKREGTSRTLVDEIKQRPIRFFLYLAIAVAVLYFSTKPFLTLGN